MVALASASGHYRGAHFSDLPAKPRPSALLRSGTKFRDRIYAARYFTCYGFLFLGTTRFPNEARWYLRSFLSDPFKIQTFSLVRN